MALIEQLLEQFPQDQRHVRFSFDHRDDGYTARATLMLPTGNLVAMTEDAVADHRAAVDQVVEKLAAEVHRHQQIVGSDTVDGPDRRRRRDFASADPHLSASRRANDRGGFFDILRPLLRQLRNHASRELMLAELEGTIPPGEVDVGDLLDEVVVRAWDRWDERPRNQPLHQWLVQLLHDILDNWGFRPPDNTGKTPRWINVDSSMGGDEATPDPHPANPDKLIEAAVRRQIMTEELAKFPRRKRRAYELHVLEGWDIEEIAFAQDRSEDEVRADIEEVRRAIQQRIEKEVG